MKRTTAVLALLCALLAGCASKPVRFTNVTEALTASDQEYLKANFDLVYSGAEITLSRHFLMMYPLSGYYQFNDETITNELLNKYKGDIVSNLQINKKLIFLLYYNRYYIVATGDVWRKKNDNK